MQHCCIPWLRPGSGAGRYRNRRSHSRTKRGQIKRRLAFLALVLLLHFSASGTAGAQSLKRIRIGYPSLSFRQSNVWVATERGLFNRYGLDVEPVLLRGGQVATQALASGDPPIVNIGTVVQATDLEANQLETFTILGAWDFDAEKGIISYLTPVGQALLNRKVSEEVEFEVHGARHRHRIERIEPFKTAPPATPSQAVLAANS